MAFFTVTYQGKEVTGPKKVLYLLAFWVLMTSYAIFMTLPGLAYFAIYGKWPSWCDFALHQNK